MIIQGHRVTMHVNEAKTAYGSGLFFQAPATSKRTLIRGSL